MDLCLSQGQVKRRQPQTGFELVSSIPSHTTITVTLSVKNVYVILKSFEEEIKIFNMNRFNFFSSATFLFNNDRGGFNQIC